MYPIHTKYSYYSYPKYIIIHTVEEFEAVYLKNIPRKKINGLTINNSLRSINRRTTHFCLLHFY